MKTKMKLFKQLIEKTSKITATKKEFLNWSVLLLGKEYKIEELKEENPNYSNKNYDYCYTVYSVKNTNNKVADVYFKVTKRQENINEEEIIEIGLVEYNILDDEENIEIMKTEMMFEAIE